MNKFKAFLARKNIAFSAKRYFIDAMGAMAQGLFCTLLVGTILNTLGTQLHIGFLTESIVTIGKGEGAVAYTIGGLCSAMVGPGMAVAIGRALEAPPLVLFSLIPVGFATNSMGGAGGPLAVLFVTILAAELGKAVSKETKIDILVTPIVTVLAGIGFAALIAAPVGKAASAVGQAIMWATELQPFFMGIIVSVVIGVALTLPISSAAICLALGLTGLAGGAAVAGCCAQMIGFAVMSFPENRWGGLAAQGLGTSMLQMGNIVRNPRVWIPPHAGRRRHRPHRHLRLWAANERPRRVQRHGYLRAGGADRCVHRLGQRRGRRTEIRHRRHGLAGSGADLLRAAGRTDVAVRHTPAEVGLDQARRPEAGSVSLSSKKRGPAASPQALFFRSIKTAAAAPVQSPAPAADRCGAPAC